MSRRRVIDISQPMHSAMQVYPGDPPFESRPVYGFDAGDSCEVSCLSMGSHCGTHIDAPKHMIPGGLPLEGMSLERFIGPCRVLNAEGPVITGEFLKRQHICEGERILLRTDPDGTYSDPGAGLNPAALNADAARILAECGILLIGIDSPSIENMDMSDGEVHRILLGSSVAVLEGLRLSDAEEGEYFLSALPLDLPGENGAPCRAVLIKDIS